MKKSAEEHDTYWTSFFFFFWISKRNSFFFFFLISKQEEFIEKGWPNNPKKSIQDVYSRCPNWKSKSYEFKLLRKLVA